MNEDATIILRGAEETLLALVLNLSKCELESLPFKICGKRTSIPLDDMLEARD